jgi:hypothetical protein
MRGFRAVSVQFPCTENRNIAETARVPRGNCAENRREPSIGLYRPLPTWQTPGSFLLALIAINERSCDWVLLNSLARVPIADLTCACLSPWDLHAIPRTSRWFQEKHVPCKMMEYQQNDNRHKVSGDPIYTVVQLIAWLLEEMTSKQQD